MAIVYFQNNGNWCGRSSPLMESSSPSPSSSGQGDPSSSGQASTSKVKSPSQQPSKKICGVCGDRAKSYHFGGISCDSCKAFFRRSVQNDAHKNFQCSYDYDCEINITSRKCCQYCRFQKCLRIGMEKSWVMTEEERMQILRQRMERRASRQLDRERATATTAKRLASEEEVVLMTEEETESIRDIVQRYTHSFQQVPYSPELRGTNDNRSMVEIVAMISTTIRRMTHYAGHLDIFAQLSQSDQASLLRGGMVELCLIRAVYAFDNINNCWPNVNIPLYRDCPLLKVSDLQRIVSPELHEMHMRFNASMREMNLDENAIMLFLMVSLFTPDRPGLEAEAQISSIQERYLGILKKYITWKYSAEVSSKLYPKILLKLPDLRQLNDAHTESQLRLMEEEVTEIQRHVVGEILGGEERRFDNGQQAGPSHVDGPAAAKRLRLPVQSEAAQATESRNEDMPSTFQQFQQQHSVVSVIKESVIRSREEPQHHRSSSESSST